ncbi:protein kinase domain-containing protein [Cryptosporangium phraense]|uniref:non-specific serine/threonine protein kinase n=1 Tax=Cryptosporangium phraense TaxID=2593070 RepID=A0A545AIB5_9ACTN|nr:protein kinase [Cryptosporangium phraense]TQS41056.1 protein kinase [Cryptosporangium phraense]
MSAPGRVVDRRYRLDSVVGTGGMGVVWRGFDLRLHRPVAVKELRIPPTSTDEERAELVDRAMREARAAGKLNHPNIISVHDVVEDYGTPFIVMPLVSGRSLSDVIGAAGPLPPVLVARIGLMLLDALDAAHEAGVWHRDVKPENVMVQPDGTVLLTDFSIASVLGAGSRTLPGVVMGTPGFIAPERVLRGAASGAGDLFGLGATLYAAVEAVDAFDTTDALAGLFASATRPHRAAEKAGPLAPVLDGLLAKEPDDRLTTAQARDLLYPIVNGSPQSSAAALAALLRATPGLTPTPPPLNPTRVEPFPPIAADPRPAGAPAGPGPAGRGPGLAAGGFGPAAGGFGPAAGAPGPTAGGFGPTAGGFGPTGGGHGPAAGGFGPAADGFGPAAGAPGPAAGEFGPAGRSAVGGGAVGGGSPGSRAVGDPAADSAPAAGWAAVGGPVPGGPAGAPPVGGPVPDSPSSGASFSAPTSGPPPSGPPASAFPASALPASGGPAAAGPTPATAAPASVTRAPAAPAPGAPTSGAPASSAPASGAPASAAPTPGAPASAAPAPGGPTTAEPASGPTAPAPGGPAATGPTPGSAFAPGVASPPRPAVPSEPISGPPGPYAAGSAHPAPGASDPYAGAPHAPGDSAAHAPGHSGPYPAGPGGYAPGGTGSPATGTTQWAPPSGSRRRRYLLPAGAAAVILLLAVIVGLVLLNNDNGDPTTNTSPTPLAQNSKKPTPTPAFVVGTGDDKPSDAEFLNAHKGDDQASVSRGRAQINGVEYDESVRIKPACTTYDGEANDAAWADFEIPGTYRTLQAYVGMDDRADDSGIGSLHYTISVDGTQVAEDTIYAGSEPGQLSIPLPAGASTIRLAVSASSEYYCEDGGTDAAVAWGNAILVP